MGYTLICSEKQVPQSICISTILNATTHPNDLLDKTFSRFRASITRLLVGRSDFKA